MSVNSNRITTQPKTEPQVKYQWPTAYVIRLMRYDAKLGLPVIPNDPKEGNFLNIRMHESTPTLSCLVIFSWHTTLLFILENYYEKRKPITVAARSRAWTVFARSNTGIVGSNPTLKAWISVLCAFILCVGRGLATGWSPIQGVLRTVYRIKAKAQQRAVEPW
jgi:hypothetical protein